jgi:hypothetical protein
VVGRNAVEPGEDPGVRGIGACGAINFQKNILHQVAGGFSIAGKTAYQPIDALLVPGHEQPEGVGIFPGCGLEKLKISSLIEHYEKSF